MTDIPPASGRFVIEGLIFGFVPRWGGVLSAVCTIVATFTGFKAGVKYHEEIIR